MKVFIEWNTAPAFTIHISLKCKCRMHLKENTVICYCIVAHNLIETYTMDDVIAKVGTNIRHCTQHLTISCNNFTKPYVIRHYATTGYLTNIYSQTSLLRENKNQLPQYILKIGFQEKSYWPQLDLTGSATNAITNWSTQYRCALKKPRTGNSNMELVNG